MAYGDKRDYCKIDLYCGGQYLCSTTWAKSLKEAIAKWKEANPNDVRVIYAHYADK